MLFLNLMAINNHKLFISYPLFSLFGFHHHFALLLVCCVLCICVLLFLYRFSLLFHSLFYSSLTKCWWICLEGHNLICICHVYLNWPSQQSIFDACFQNFSTFHLELEWICQWNTQTKNRTSPQSQWKLILKLNFVCFFF